MTRYAMHVVLVMAIVGMLGGCVTTPDDIVSRWQ